MVTTSSSNYLYVDRDVNGYILFRVAADFLRRKSNPVCNCNFFAGFLLRHRLWRAPKFIQLHSLTCSKVS